MNRKSLLCLPFILIVTAFNLAFAQEVQRAEDILRWFPQGEYRVIAHQDDELLASSKACDEFRGYFGGWLENSDPEGNKISEDGAPGITRGSAFLLGAPGSLDENITLLPESLREGVISSTYGGWVKILQEQRKEGSTVELIDEKSEGGKTGAKGVLVSSDTDLNVAVFRYLDLDSVIKKALKDGYLTDTGKKISGATVYTFSSDHPHSKRAAYFAWISPTNELLVSNHRGYLRAMIDTGSGENPSILDDDAFIELTRLVPDLGALWRAYPYAKTREKIIEHYKQADMDSEQRNARIEEEEKGVQLKVDTWRVEGQVINQIYEIYFNSTHAEEAMAKARARGSRTMKEAPAFDALMLLLKERMKLEVQSNFFISTLVYDAKLAEALNKASLDVIRHMEQNGGSIHISWMENGRNVAMSLGSRKPTKK
jgi:hypothetical protein